MGPSSGIASITPRAPLASFSRLFPDIAPFTITAVLDHTLRARDLYLLDPRIRDVEPSYVFNGLTSWFEESTSKFRAYSSLDCVTIPLHNYFAILLAHNLDVHALPVYLFSYLTHLQMLAADYDWEAVLEYHTLFFNRRAREMEENGDYSAWGNPDVFLLCTHVYPHRNSLRSTPPCLPEPASCTSPAALGDKVAAPPRTPRRRPRLPRPRSRIFVGTSRHLSTRHPQPEAH